MALQLSRQFLFAFRPEDVKIGELLVLSGVITQSQLLQTLKNSRLPTGQQYVAAPERGEFRSAFTRRDANLFN